MCNPDVPDCAPDLGHIDAAVDAAFRLAGMDPDVLPHSMLYLTFHNGLIEYPDGKAYGLTTIEPAGEDRDGTDDFIKVQVMYTPCLFDAEGSLVHEMLHVALWHRDFDVGSHHDEPEWKQVGDTRRGLQQSYCQPREIE